MFMNKTFEFKFFSSWKIYIVFFIRESDENEFVPNLLEAKNKKLFELYNRMTQTDPSQKPDCESYSKKSIFGL